MTGKGLGALRSKLKPKEPESAPRPRPGKLAGLAALSKIRTRADLMPTDGDSVPHTVSMDTGVASDNAVIRLYGDREKLDRPGVLAAGLHLALKGKDMTRSEASEMFGEPGEIAWDHNESIRQRVALRYR